MSATAVSVCPVLDDPSVATLPPSPETLAYSLTLPADLTSPLIARATTRAVLQLHRLEDVTDAVVQVVGELAACACRFTPGAEVYLSLRCREGALRVIFYDGHPRHTHPRLAAACDARRRAAGGVAGVGVRGAGL